MFEKLFKKKDKSISVNKTDRLYNTVSLNGARDAHSTIFNNNVLNHSIIFYNKQLTNYKEGVLYITDKKDGSFKINSTEPYDNDIISYLIINY